MNTILPNRQTHVKGNFCLFGFAEAAWSGDIRQMGNRIKEVRDQKGLTLEQVADAAGISAGYLSRMETGGRNVSLKNLAKLSKALGIQDRDLVSADRSEVPLVGMVSAGTDAVTVFGEGQGPFEMVTAPPDATDKTVAVELRGTSMGKLLDKWLAFYDDRRDPPDERTINEVCICGLEDGRVVIKKLMKGSSKGLWHLESQTDPTLFDAKVSWAAKVIQLRPR